MIALIVLAAVGAVALLCMVRAVRVVPQARAYVVERLGSYSRTLDAGLNTVVPFVDRIRAKVDLREQVVSFAPQPVITEDNLVVHIDTVLYFQVIDPKAATYEIANFIQGIEQLTVTTLRNVIGGMDLEKTLTSREDINAQLRGVLDEATGKWGIRVNRVELKAIDPPASIKDAMEKQLRAERDKRATILTAEGLRQSQNPDRRRRQAECDLNCGRRAAVSSLGRARAGTGHRGRLRGHSPRPTRCRAAGLPVPADAAEDRRRGRQQTVDAAQRADPGSGRVCERVRRPRRRGPSPAARSGRPRAPRPAGASGTCPRRESNRGGVAVVPRAGVQKPPAALPGLTTCVALGDGLRQRGGDDPGPVPAARATRAHGRAPQLFVPPTTGCPFLGDLQRPKPVFMGGDWTVGGDAVGKPH